jgi:type II secretory pathway component GspD/PulD (secretin)
LRDGQIAKADPPVKDLFGGSVTPPEAATDAFGPTDWGIDLSKIGLNAALGGGELQYSGIGTLTSHFKQNLTLLAREDLARIVTNPHVSVVNGHKGSILLDERFNFLTTIVQPLGTTSEQQNELNNVTALTVTPTVLGPDRIHLAVNSTLSVYVGNVTGAVVAFDLPDQRINDIATSVVLGDNETLIIGGLIREEVVEERDKIPGFARLPILGHLFRGTDTERRYTETVIYITPRLAQPQGWEDMYLEQVFRQIERMQERGETIREEHRTDKYRAKGLYRFNEKLDRQQCKLQHRQARYHVAR